MAQSPRELYWLSVLADFRQSRLTHVQFCHARGVSLHSFRSWLYRLRPGMPPPRPRTSRYSTSETAQPTNPPAFLPVHVLRPSLAPTLDRHVSQPPAPLELVLNESCRVRVPTGFDPTSLHQLLDVLEQRS